MISCLMAGGSDRHATTQDTRERVLDAASKLIVQGGIAALTTRAVAAAASVQPPALYRLFGEKRGLLNAVAERGLAPFVAQKASAKLHPDPVQDLRNAWDGFVAFGLANPAVFAIMNEIGAPGPAPPAMLTGISILRERVQRIARKGQLRMPVERAVALIHAAGVGTVATLLATPVNMRDSQLATSACDAVLAAIVAGGPMHPRDAGIAPLAVALANRLGEAGGLTPGERLLLGELLDRLSAV
ncbi:hypothetical protein KOAAANKH_00832 [Brevundimonas sp. NIBR10]|nr:hypothetical protein KOAAANKH_00832 [Brevundimonas sp. NIBR10]